MVPARRGDVQNGAHNSQPQLHGGSDVPIASTAPQTAEASAPQRSSQIVPRPPTSQSVSVTSDTRKPTIPAKPPADASKGVAFQRGFISPGFMNEMQPQMGPQIPQMGNLGISMASQCPQQLGRKFGGPRKIPMKITHQELRLDKRTDSYPDGGPSAPRTHPNIPPQSQPIPSFAHPHTTTTYYANSYNPSSLYYPAPISHPLTSSHMPPNSQARRFSYPGSQASQHVPFINPSSHSTLPVSKSGSLVHNVLDPPNLEHARDVRNVSASVPSATGPVVIKPPAGTVGQKVVDPLPNSSTVVEKGELSKPLRQSGEIMQSAGDQSILKSLPVMEKVSASATATASVEKQVSNLLSSSSDAPTEESVPVVTTTEPRRIIDRQEGAARLHHRGSGIMDNDRWNKGGAANFRTGQVPNFGVLRNPHAPKLETSDTGEQVRGADDSDKDGHEHGAKKYSRDFLLKFSVQYTELPEGFEIMSDIAQILNANVNAAPSIYYDSLPSPGRIVDRQGGAARLDRRGSGIMDDDRWNMGGAANFRTGQGPNFGVLRNPHAPKLETSDTGEQVRGADDSDKDGHEHGAKKYSRDFLLKFSVQYTELPEGFEIMSDIAQILNANVNAAPSIYYDSLPSPGRIVDRQGGAARLDRRGSGIMDDDRWNMGGAANFRTGQVPNFGVLRNPHAPKLETSDTGEQVRGADDSDKDGHEHGAKKYFRDFLLKFSVQYTELPEGFEIMSDIAQILNANVNAAPSIYYDSLPSPGRIVDRQGGAARLDRRGSGIMDDDRWNMGGAANFRTGQGPKFGVLRNPRALTPVQQHVRGILPGPAHSVGHQGGMQRNNSDADRWQRAANFQPKGLMPSPHTPLQVMHKADRKYEVGKVSDEEQAKQRQLKAILNKLTPQNFEKLFEQVKAVNMDNAMTLTGVISQIFDKALMEPTFCEMYANFCFYLAGELPDFSEDNEKITFKILLYNKCQEEFERGGRQQEETNKADEEGQVKQSEEEREGKRIKARRQRLGNVSLIGELYKKRMLTERIMHKCIEKLFGQQQTPDEQDIEALCILMSTIGEMIDHPKAKKHMDAYFERMKSLSNNMKLSSRVRFMLKDAIDLRKNKWQQRSKVEGPKNIEEVHRDAAQNVPSENVLTEDRLRDMSLAAIREFYSARDEKEAALCIKDLNSPSFHPSMISLWVTDSFERKDAERDLLAKLLVNLTKTHDGTLSQSQLIKGFETVLSTLEDTVIDAPRAPEFLGLIFAKVILENVVSLNQISQLIHEDGEELAGNILGDVLEIIKSEKGDNGFNEVRTSSNLLLETF